MNDKLVALREQIVSKFTSLNKQQQLIVVVGAIVTGVLIFKFIF